MKSHAVDTKFYSISGVELLKVVSLYSSTMVSLPHLFSKLTHLYEEETARHFRPPLTTETAPALHHLFLYQDPPLSHPLIGSSQL